MTRVHPQFLMNGFKKAVEKQDFGEFNKELTNGMNYWTNLFNTEVGALDPDEAPLIIAHWKNWRVPTRKRYLAQEILQILSARTRKALCL